MRAFVCPCLLVVRAAQWTFTAVLCTLQFIFAALSAVAHLCLLRARVRAFAKSLGPKPIKAPQKPANPTLSVVVFATKHYYLQREVVRTNLGGLPKPPMIGTATNQPTKTRILLQMAIEMSRKLVRHCNWPFKLARLLAEISLTWSWLQLAKTHDRCRLFTARTMANDLQRKHATTNVWKIDA